jgi:hypothetical protein
MIQHTHHTHYTLYTIHDTPYTIPHTPTIQQAVVDGAEVGDVLIGLNTLIDPVLVEDMPFMTLIGTARYSTLSTLTMHAFHDPHRLHQELRLAS